MSAAQPIHPHHDAWSASGFAEELIPVCGPTDRCGSPGKIPHMQGWQTAEIKPSEFKPGMNLGLRTRYFPAIDIDVEDEGIVAAVTDVARELFGTTARRRRSNSARCALLYKLSGEPFKKAKVTFTAPDGRPAKIEFLGDGQQLVVAGVHHSNAALEWEDAPPSADKLARITKETREEFLSAMRDVLESAGCRDVKIDAGETRNGAKKKTETVRSLNGSAREHAYALGALKKACKAIRGANEGERNDTLNREAFGIAQLVAGGMLDAASSESALEAAAEAGGLEPKEARATVRSAFGGGEKNPRGLPTADAPTPSSTATPPPLEARRISLEDATSPPVERFILGPMLPLEKPSVVFGPTSIGKSAAIAQIAFHLAGGSESLWGLPLFSGGAPVLVYSAEDTFDDWKRKAAAIRNAGGIDMERALERLYVIDKSEGLARLSEVVTVRTEGAIKTEAVSRRIARPTEEQDRLIAEARRIGARLIVVETASRLVDDEDNPSFAGLMAALGRIGRETGAAILLSHHATKAASKENDSAIENARGGGALIANARNALSLFPADEHQAKPYCNRFAAEDLAVLVHGKGTSSTRRHQPIILVRCGATYGAVFRLPDEVSQSPEMALANAARLERERQLEMEGLCRLYAVVEQLLPTKPAISPSWLRENSAKDLAVSKHRVEPLVRRGLELGVLKENTRTARTITVTLGRDPRKPSHKDVASWASPGESSEIES